MNTLNQTDGLVTLMTDILNVLLVAKTAMIGASSVDHAHPMVQFASAIDQTLYMSEKAFADFPLAINGTDETKLFGNLGIYWFGSYAILIALLEITVYASLGLLNKFSVQVLLVDPMKWLHRFN